MAWLTPEMIRDGGPVLLALGAIAALIWAIKRMESIETKRDAERIAYEVCLVTMRSEMLVQLKAGIEVVSQNTQAIEAFKETLGIYPTIERLENLIRDGYGGHENVPKRRTN